MGRRLATLRDTLSKRRRCRNAFVVSALRDSAPLNRRRHHPPCQFEPTPRSQSSASRLGRPGHPFVATADPHRDPRHGADAALSAIPTDQGPALHRAGGRGAAQIVFRPVSSRPGTASRSPNGGCLRVGQWCGLRRNADFRPGKSLRGAADEVKERAALAATKPPN